MAEFLMGFYEKHCLKEEIEDEDEKGRVVARMKERGNNNVSDEIMEEELDNKR